MKKTESANLGSNDASKQKDDNLHWRISRSCETGACVSVAMRPDGSVLVRDTKNTERQPLCFTRKEWAAFVEGVKGSEFDVS